MLNHDVSPAGENGSERIPSPQDRLRELFQQPFTNANGLRSALVVDIKLHGPLPFQQYMELALYHPTAGYYTKEAVLADKPSRRHPRGVDFFTNPVTYSPEFGEGVADMAAALWGAGEIKRVISLASGNGVLDRDFLNHVEQHYPGMYEHLNYVIVEMSPQHVEKISETLARHIQAGKVKIIQQNAVTFLAEEQSFAQSFIFSNELLDAFPAQPYRLDEGIWREEVVTVDENGKLIRGLGAELEKNSDAFTYLQRLKDTAGPLFLNPRPTQEDILGALFTLIPDLRDKLQNDIRGLSLVYRFAHSLHRTFQSYSPSFVANPSSQRIADALNQHSNDANMYVLTMDYGSAVPPESVRFFAKPRYWRRNAINNPGIFDITYDVDFLEFAKRVGLPTVGGLATDTGLLYAMKAQMRDAAPLWEKVLGAFTGRRGKSLADDLDKIDAKYYLALVQFTAETANADIAEAVRRAHLAFTEINGVNDIFARLGVPYALITDSLKEQARRLLVNGYFCHTKVAAPCL